MLVDGMKGLGFGCGKVPMMALMAKMGTNVVVTDLASEGAAKSGWIAGNQHLLILEDLNRNGLCNPDIFRERVKFRTCDVNNITSNLRGFDFLWSSCSLEHLGSLQRGLTFIENSLNCLRPGGIAVHTTEFNLGSNEKTLESDTTSIYRKKDIENLALRLLDMGHSLGSINFTPGTELPDLHIDLPPYKSSVHLRLLIKRHLCTSIGLFIKKKI